MTYNIDNKNINMKVKQVCRERWRETERKKRHIERVNKDMFNELVCVKGEKRKENKRVCEIEKRVKQRGGRVYR